MADFTLAHIEQYFNDKLPEDDRKAFEQKMAADESFRKEVADHRLIFEGLKGLEIENFREKVGGWEAEISAPPQKRDATKSSVRTMWARWSVAASVLLLITSGAYFVMHSNYSAERLIVANYEQPVLPGPRSGSPAMYSLDQGITAMKNRDYVTALQLLNNVSSNDPEFMEAQFYTGHCHFLLENTNEAITAFQKVAASGDSRFAGIAEWMEMLGHFQNGETDQAREMLQQMAGQPGHSYQSKAAEMLRSIDSFWYRITN